MGYQLVVWEGKRPVDDVAGRREFQAVTQQYLFDEPVPPTPAIRSFVEALSGMWPDDPRDPRCETSPWKCLPALDEVSGPVLLIDLLLDTGVIASTVIASLAEEHGLVAYDLMVGMLRPVSDEVVAEHARRWASPLN